MPKFEATRRVAHTPDEMFALVADVEKYPQFLPLCESLTVRSRRERDGKTVLVADMSVGYKAIRETFTTQVLLKPAEKVIDVKYIDGPFRYLTNLWGFEPASDGCFVVRPHRWHAVALRLRVVTFTDTDRFVLKMPNCVGAMTCKATTHACKVKQKRFMRILRPLATVTPNGCLKFIETHSTYETLNIKTS